MNKKPHGKVILVSTIIAILMFGFTFALVPLYNVLCRATGLNGKINLFPVINQNVGDYTRPILVQFVTTNNNNLPWDFRSDKTKIETFAGKNTRTIFFAKNNSKKTMTVQAIPSITPWQAAKYFYKIQCFCFEKQTLMAGQSISMPVIFYIDKKLPKEIQTITLSYTLFDVTSLH